MARVIAIGVACGLAGKSHLLAAIASVESRGNPIALHVNGAMELVRQPRSQGEAVAMASWLLAHGYNFDAGLAQVNSANFSRLGLDAESVFEPCSNLRAAAVVLAECQERARVRGLSGRRAEAATLSCYNTGDLSRGVTNGYAAAVRAALLPRQPDRRSRLPSADLKTPAFPAASRRQEVFALASRDAFASPARREP